MKKLILLLIGTLFISCSYEGTTEYSIESEKVFLLICENTTESELYSIAKEFKEKRNITVDFSKSEFRRNGTIKNLNLSVDCNDGFKGTIKNYGKTFNLNKSGFWRDYKENSAEPFRIGNIEK